MNNISEIFSLYCRYNEYFKLILFYLSLLMYVCTAWMVWCQQVKFCWLQKGDMSRKKEISSRSFIFIYLLHIYWHMFIYKAWVTDLDRGWTVDIVQLGFISWRFEKTKVEASRSRKWAGQSLSFLAYQFELQSVQFGTLQTCVLDIIKSSSALSESRSGVGYPGGLGMVGVVQGVH